MRRIEQEQGGILVGCLSCGYEFFSMLKYFFVVGRTKNAANRLFNIAKTSLRKQNVYKMKQFISLIGESVFFCAIEVYENDSFD